MKLSESAAEVIRLATEIRNYWETELPKRHPNYPVISGGEDSGPPPPEKKQLRDLLKSLPDERIHQLALLMYLGRGDFGTDDLAGQIETVKKRFGNTDWAISQMMEKAPLAEYLTDGVDELQKNGIDLDTLIRDSVHSAN